MIKDKLFKIELIQTLPGVEFDVACRLKEACRNFGIDKHLVLKGLGGFDILFIYETSTYDFNLTRHGVIPGIINFNQILSFSSREADLDTIFGDNEDPFLCLTLFKLNLDYKNKVVYKDVLTKLRERLDSEKTNYSEFGTLGWNDAIVLFNGKSINAFYDLIVNLSYSEHSEIIAKSNSYVGIKYDMIFGPDCFQDNHRCEVSTHDGLSESIDPKIDIRINISCMPQFTSEIRQYWSATSFDVYDTIGKSDITLLRNPENGNDLKWSTFIEQLLNFRQQFKNKLSNTESIIAIKNENREIGYSHKERDIEDLSVSIRYELLTQYYGEDVAARVASKFYEFNSLIQNPISGDAYYDLESYPFHIMKTAETHFENEIPTSMRAETALTCVEALHHGCELRSCGTLTQLETNISRHGKLKGGAQASFSYWVLACKVDRKSNKRKISLEWIY